MSATYVKPLDPYAISLGRYWGSARSAALQSHNEGDATVTFSWDDGAVLRITYDTKEEAIERLHSLNFFRQPETEAQS